MKKVQVREEVCMGCGLCEVFCQLEHSASKDLLKAFKRESPAPALLSVGRRGPVSFAVTCRHCDEPLCVYACLTGALTKDPMSGVVSVDTEKCVGCWTCILACPFGVIRQDKRQGKVAKCYLCGGEGIPACVANCPNEALLYVEVEDRVPA